MITEILAAIGGITLWILISWITFRIAVNKFDAEDIGAGFLCCGLFWWILLPVLIMLLLINYIGFLFSIPKRLEDIEKEIKDIRKIKKRGKK